MRIATGLLLGALAGGAAAGPIYKCEDNDAVTYTDQPCASGAIASELPGGPLSGVVVVASPTRSELDLARQHDARTEREKSARSRADSAWLKAHRERKDRAEAVRKAIIEHRVIRGMTMAEVKSALGEPQQVDRSESYGSSKETWKYTGDGRTRTVNFKDGQVSTSGKREKGGR